MVLTMINSPSFPLQMKMQQGIDQLSNEIRTSADVERQLEEKDHSLKEVGRHIHQCLFTP
jgi:hypothetical protein